MKHISGRFMQFRSIRARLLVWYFLLAVCTTGVAVSVTRQLYCARIDEQAEAFLVEEVERFQRSAEPLRNRQPSDREVRRLFDQVLADYIPAQNEVVLTFVEGQLYGASQPLPEVLQRHPDLIEQWSSLDVPQREQVSGAAHRLFYIAEPLTTDAGVQGAFVAVRDSTAAYQSGTEVMVLVLKVSAVVLTGFFFIAWITAGRLLMPLRLINQTAREITESDMTQRIAVQSSDEISEVAATFNAMLDRLQLAFDGQQEFLKDVSHELRTPITVIQGQLEMLPYRPEAQPETIALITTELEQMNRLVNDLLLLSKAEHPDFLVLKPEDLDWLTEELYLKARSLTPDRDWRLEAKGLYPVLIDRQRFSQAVMNLVQNAVRHTQPGDTVALGSVVSDGAVKFWVRDSGEGIDQADQDRIFERFTRATHSNYQFEGVGLGLSIVSAIVQAHHGQIELSSTLGQGSTFTLTLPQDSSLASPETDRHEPHLDRRGQPSHR